MKQGHNAAEELRVDIIFQSKIPEALHPVLEHMNILEARSWYQT